MALNTDERLVFEFLFRHKDVDAPSITDICEGTGLTKLNARRILYSLQERRLVGGPPSLLGQTMAMLKNLDKNFEPTDAGYNEHVILLASAFTAANESTLAEELGFDVEFVATVGSRLRSSGIWSGDALDEKHRVAWEKDAIAFYCDGAIATGDLMIVGKNANGEAQYQMTPGGMSRAATLFKKGQPRKRG